MTAATTIAPVFASATRPDRDNKPLKESLEKFAKFPISTSFEKCEPRLLLVAAGLCKCCFGFG